jgi:5-methylcytosine-specific restriction endonuclease McrA
MNFEIYLSNLIAKKKLSEVKLVILQRLWGGDDVLFPKPWVSSAELLALTGQKYFDRRSRELRDQLGCDILTEYRGEFAGHGWRLSSCNLADAQDREYLSLPQKNKLFSDAANTCSVCGKVAEAGVRGLQADHRVPLSRGGGNELNNWQPLCNHCNVGKRRACEGCALECKKCSWAYPETIGVSTLVSLSSSVLSNITAYSKTTGKTLSQILEEVMKDFFTTK